MVLDVILDISQTLHFFRYQIIFHREALGNFGIENYILHIVLQGMGQVTDPTKSFNCLISKIMLTGHNEWKRSCLKVMGYFAQTCILICMAECLQSHIFFDLNLT